MSIREVRDYYNLRQHLKVDPTKLPPGLENMCCEVYNRSNETITFRTNHPEWLKMYFFGLGPDFWNVLQCPPGEWVFLPHGQYIPSVPSGSKEIAVIVNVGDAMFKGNTLPSRPEDAQIRVFT